MKRWWWAGTLVFTGVLGGFFLWQQSETAVTQRQTAELQAIAETLYAAILSGDGEAIIKIVAPPKRPWGFIEFGEGFEISIEEVEQHLRERNGWAHAILFDTAQWQALFGPGQLESIYLKREGPLTGKDLVCLRDLLRQAGSAVQVRVTVEPERPEAPVFGQIYFDWPGNDQTLFGLPGAAPLFVYTEHGWRMLTYFGR